MEERIFDRKLKQLGIVLTERMKEQFDRYFELLVEWNTVMNLTGITDYDEVNEKHFLDSLAVAKVQNMGKISTVIDIGTGAGFPGIPLKIVYPHLKVTLLDSLNKRIKFLNCVIQELSLEYITALHGRAEDFARKADHRESYDLCVSRAVANLATLSEYCLPYVEKGGLFISYKSGEIDEELQKSEKAVSILGGKIDSVEKFCLPDSDIARSFVKKKKEKNPPGRSPRKAGLPAKDPLH